MSSTITRVESLTNIGNSKVKDESKKPRHLMDRIIKIISVDADGFCESKEWPYLWSGQHRKNHKKP